MKTHTRYLFSSVTTVISCRTHIIAAYGLAASINFSSIRESQAAVREEKIWEQIVLQRRWLLRDASLLDYT